MNTILQRSLALAAATALAAGLAACSTGDEGASVSESASGAWPRTIEHASGETELDAQPETIVSTSVTLTGILLAIDAPVAASAATTPSAGLTDDQGFFAQWADVADERGVDVLYPNLELDLESVIAADPDLIVVSATGADSTADSYEQLSEIAPTVVLDYSSASWQELAVELGEATGLEDDAASAIADYDAEIAAIAEEITVPAGDANAIVYNGTGETTAFAKPGGPHAELLDSLGFTIVGAPDELDTSETARDDFSFLSTENAVATLTAPTVFIVSGDQSVADELVNEPIFANAPAVTDGTVVALGDASFRIDPYSARDIADIVAAQFG